MRLRKMALALVCVLAVSALLPAAAGAAFGNGKSASADAWWSSWDWESGEPGPTDTIAEKGISGWRASSVWKEGKSSAEIMKETSGGVWMYSYEPASGADPQRWTQFNCYSMDPYFVIAKKLSSATLEYMAPGVTEIWIGDEPWVEDGDDFYLREPDQTIEHGIVSVMATWKPTGPVSRSMYLSRERSEDFRYMDRSQQTYRNASARVSVVSADEILWMENAVSGSIYESRGTHRFPF